MPNVFQPVASLSQIEEMLCAHGQRFEMRSVVIRGVATRTWLNAPETVRSIIVASEEYGDRLATIYQGERVSFDAQCRATQRLAHHMSSLGIVKGDRVAIAMRNLPEWPVAFFAALTIGAIAVPLNAWWTPNELRYGLTDSGASLLIADLERFQQIAPLLGNLPGSLPVLIASDIDSDLPPGSSLASIIGHTSTWATLSRHGWPTVTLAPESHATIFYSSGTTGKPKGVLGTHRNLASIVMAAGYVACRAALRRGDSVPTPKHRTVLIAVPLFHVTGCVAGLITATAAGTTNIYMRRWDAVEAMRIIERERVNTTGGVPTIAWQLLEHPQRQHFDLSSLEGLGYGGAPAPPALLQKINDAGLSGSNGWGMTETTAMVTSNTAEDYLSRPTSCGPPVPVSDLRIVPEGSEHSAEANQVGELWARGPQVASGYWNDTFATRNSFIEGWVKTGDLAYLDDEGFCYIVDRLKDVIIRGGENIYAPEVEFALMDHPDILDAAVIGIPDHLLGEEPAAFLQVSPTASVTDQALRDWLIERISAFKIPVKFVRVTANLERNAAGKLNKAALRSVMLSAG